MQDFKFVITSLEVWPATKTAMVSPATPKDRAWIGKAHFRASDLKQRQEVDRVNHFGRHTTERGDLLAVKDLKHNVIVHLRVTRIRVMDLENSTDEEFMALGYKNRQDFATGEYSHAAKGRHWYIEVEQIPVE